MKKYSTLPEHYVLRKIEWQVIGALTFKSFVPERIRVPMFFELTRKTSKLHGIYWPRLLWVLKEEYGGTEMPHFHFLLAGLPEPSLNARSCDQLRSIWKKSGGGHSRIELFDRNQALNGLEYILKCSEEVSGSVRREVGNLQAVGGIQLSNSILKLQF